MTTKPTLRRVTPAVFCATTFCATALTLTGSAVIDVELPTDAQSSATEAYEPLWSWPHSPAPSVWRHFDPPTQPWLPGHRGVDLAVPGGAEVRSPAAGRVVFSGWVVNRPVVTVDHGGGLLSSFEPVTALLDRGQLVQEGQAVGILSAGSDSAASHCPVSCLHWGVRLNGDYVDPLNFVTDRRPSVLLPLHGP